MISKSSDNLLIEESGRTHANWEDKRQQRWDMQTYNAWLDIIEEEQALELPESERSGLKCFRSTLLWDALDHKELRRGGVSSLWFSKQVHDFEVIGDCDLPQGTSAGARFTSVAVDVPKYLCHLLRRIRELGATIVKGRVMSSTGMPSVLNEVERLVRRSNSYEGGIDVLVNATGLGSKHLFRDDQMFPVRGQTLLVRGDAHQITVKHGADSISYAIPRGNGSTVLGGCMQYGNWSGAAAPIMTATILEKCRSLCPELLRKSDCTEAQFEVIATNVGLRPGREGGARVELEIGQSCILVHAYGHAGGGFQNSHGVSSDVLALLQSPGSPLDSAEPEQRRQLGPRPGCMNGAAALSHL